MDIEQPAQLIAYLRTKGHVRADETPRVQVLAGGVSNRTVLVEREGQAWVLKQALAKLRVAVDWWSPPERIEREALGMKHLARLAPAGSIVPLVFEDPEHHLLAMAAVPRPHENWKEVLLSGRVDDTHVRAFGALLGLVHRGAFEDRELASIFDDRSFFESLRLEPYYAYAADQVPAARAFLERLVAETRATRFTLVHGDYSPKNVLVHEGRLVLLDHEVIHFGDGAFDVGFAQAHLLSKAHHLRRHREDFLQAVGSFWQAYGESWPGFEARAVRHALGCLLARVDGRSPLEYLDDVERIRQRAISCALMERPPATVTELVARFEERLP